MSFMLSAMWQRIYGGMFFVSLMKGLEVGEEGETSQENVSDP